MRTHPSEIADYKYHLVGEAGAFASSQDVTLCTDGTCIRILGDITTWAK